MRLFITLLLTLILTSSVHAQEKKADPGMIGIRFGPPDPCLITTVMPNSPAWEAGIRPGDYILAVSGADTKTLRLEDIATLLRGEVGASVTITLRRKDTDEVQKFVVTRISSREYERANP